MPGPCAPSLDRRKLVAGIGAIAAAGSFPAPVVAQGRPRLVVVGGGAGGATVAKCVGRDANGAIDVTLVEPLRAALKRPLLVGQEMSERDVAQREITIMADKSLPYEVLKRVMATCTDADYGRISLAVIQKEKPVAPGQFKPV